MEVPSGVFILVALCMLVAGFAMWCRRDEYPRSGWVVYWALFEDYVAKVLLLVMSVAGTIQVMVRYFGVAVSWTEALALLALVWLSFWGAAAVHRHQDHISLSLVFDILPKRLQRPVLIFGDVAVICTLAPIVWYGFENARWFDDIATVSLGAPLSTFAYAVPAALGLATVHSSFHLVEHIRSPSVSPPPGPPAEEISL